MNISGVLSPTNMFDGEGNKTLLLSNQDLDSVLNSKIGNGAVKSNQRYSKMTTNESAAKPGLIIDSNLRPASDMIRQKMMTSKMAQKQPNLHNFPLSPGNDNNTGLTLLSTSN